VKFLSIYTPAVSAAHPPKPEAMAEMGKLVTEGLQTGWLLDTGGMKSGGRVRRSNGEVTMMDGPFSEAKEMVGGYAIMKADSLEEAIELTKRFIKLAGDGECELMQLAEAGRR
jgi:hypothetical protein